MFPTQTFAQCFFFECVGVAESFYGDGRMAELGVGGRGAFVVSGLESMVLLTAFGAVWDSAG